MDTLTINNGRMSNDPEFRKFEALLDHYMAERRLNDRTLSLRAGVSEDYINKLRKRRSIPKIDYLKKLAKALEVDSRDLMPGSAPRLTTEVRPPALVQKREKSQLIVVDFRDLKAAIYSAALIYCKDDCLMDEQTLEEFVSHAAAVYARLANSTLEKTA